MTFRLLACVAFSLLVGGAAVANAASTVSPNPNNDVSGATAPSAAAKADTRIFGGFATNIFAFPGKECPPDSRVYAGPEQKDLEKMNVTYCVFKRHYAWFFKTPNLTRCPDGKDPVSIVPRSHDSYTTGRNTTEIMWCEMPNARFLHSGQLIPLEAPVAAQGKPAPSSKPNPSAVSPVGVPKEPPDLLKGVKNTPPPTAPAPAPAQPAPASGN